MFQSIKLFAVIGVVATLAACGGQEEEIIFVEPEPISVEPAFTGKYK